MIQLLLKRRGVLIGSAALLAGLFVSAMAATQFYKPNRAARLMVSLKARTTYEALPVLVTVMLSNQSLEPILINNRMLFNRYPLPGELSFQIEGPAKATFPLRKIVTPQDIRDTDLVVLPPGQTMEQEADLTDLYALRRKGKYRIQAIYYNNVDLEKNDLKTWRGTIASEPSDITID